MLISCVMVGLLLRRPWPVLATVASLPEVDYVMAAIVGAAGLLPTLEAARHGKHVLLANKEALVVSGALFVATAAVADYRVAGPRDQKIKKASDELRLRLVPNPDILAEVASLERRPFTVGFAAETERLREHALGKLSRKRLDMIAANRVGHEGRGESVWLGFFLYDVLETFAPVAEFLEQAGGLEGHRDALLVLAAQVEGQAVGAQVWRGLWRGFAQAMVVDAGRRTMDERRRMKDGRLFFIGRFSWA